ncbi:MAG TPA: transglycosylase SLT domain-containing protein [Gemmatimonadales bacterium]|nr:transglycosylase SLT domain-containing protein [Gemmatimonadales bacterium]
MLLTQLALLFQLSVAPAHYLSDGYGAAVPDFGVADAAGVSGYAGSPASLDTLLENARLELRRGRPWQASLLVAPVVQDSLQRTPSAVFVAATAASRWGGWPEVGRLLEGETWLDSLFDGRARVLLARSALERRADSTAMAHALAAPVGRDAESEGERLFLLATALDRVEMRDSAAATYLRAAAVLPTVSDWILLRAAEVTADSAGRASIYQRIASPLARERIRWVDAAAYKRAGDLEGAARRYEASGARLTAVRLRLAMSAGSTTAADTVRRDLLALVTAGGPASEVRGAIALLDSAFAPLTVEEELLVARAADEAGLAARAAAGYPKALSAGLAGQAERFGYASALARLGRNAEAAVQFGLVRSPSWMVASAAYLRARSLVRDGQAGKGRVALAEIPVKYPRDTTAASSALFLLGDLASDDRADRLARTYYRRAALRYPTSRFAAAARFRAAMVELLTGDAAMAGREFDELARRYPRSDEAPASVYWAGRAWSLAGDSVKAHARWRKAIQGDPTSYYASLAARRLGVPAWVPAESPDTFVPVPDADSVVLRAALLARLGMATEARWEHERLAQISEADPERLLAVANALRSQGLASQAIRLARKALAKGAPADARTYRLLYPVVHQDALLAEAAEQGLDPSFVAALIRQESMFNPTATSPAGARGLMQVMPQLGGRLAESLSYPVWDPVLLYQPDVSLQLGSYHLQELAVRYTEPSHVLAAYNAGVSRVERWAKRTGVDDPEVFAERIPFVETRGYVRIISRNQELYRSLYEWPGLKS